MRNLVLRMLRGRPVDEGGCSVEQLTYAQRESA
jgi:hypothetical protein